MDQRQAKAIYEEIFGKAPPERPVEAPEPIAEGETLCQESLARYAAIIREAFGGVKDELQRRRELAERVLGRSLEDPAE